MKHNGANEATDLSGRQLLTLPYLVAAPSLTEAAKLADVGRTTLYRWMEDHNFRQEPERLRKEAKELSCVELMGLMLKAVLVLGDAMDHDNPLVRLRAAQTALSVGIKVIDNKELQRRVYILEDALRLSQKRKYPW